jgi:hypothetical protein
VNRGVVLVSFQPDATPDEVRSWYSVANAVPGGSASENLPGSVGGVDAVWDLRTADELSDLPPIMHLTDDPCLASAEVLALDVIASGYGELSGARIKRTLALTVRKGTPEGEVQLFERSLLGMPEHIPEIRSWSLSRVRPEASRGRWTHVWEQEYADLAGLRVAYMQSPYHWTGVDRWFDPEMPCAIVEPQLAHMFGWADRALLTSSIPPDWAAVARPR